MSKEEDVEKLAAKYGLTSETIRLSNVIDNFWKALVEAGYNEYEIVTNMVACAVARSPMSVHKLIIETIIESDYNEMEEHND